MKVSQKIQKQISKFAEGTPFKYDQLAIERQDFMATTKTIERLIAKGVIKRLSKGLFYKPKKTIFGELLPNEEELLKTYLYEKGKRIAYITGTSLYNQMGLTTQISTSLKIACKTKRISLIRNNLKVLPVKSYVNVSNENYFLLEILDAIKDFKKIPDIDKGSAIIILSNKINILNDAELNSLIKCSLYYPPRVRSFLGALIENNKNDVNLSKLKKSLNPLSDYDYGIKNMLPTLSSWNIK